MKDWIKRGDYVALTDAGREYIFGRVVSDPRPTLPHSDVRARRARIRWYDGGDAFEENEVLTPGEIRVLAGLSEDQAYLVALDELSS